jgi:hypothetical protein
MSSCFEPRAEMPLASYLKPISTLPSAGSVKWLTSSPPVVNRDKILNCDLKPSASATIGLSRALHENASGNNEKPRQANRASRLVDCAERPLAPEVTYDQSASKASSAPADGAAGLAFCGSGHADTINSCPTRSASRSDLRDHAVRMMKRRGRHGLRRRCDG